MAMDPGGEPAPPPARLPAAFVFVLVCCWAQVIWVLARLTLGIPEHGEFLVFECALAGACLLVAVGIHARNNAGRLVLIALLTGMLTSAALSGMFVGILWARNGTRLDAGDVWFRVVLGAAILLSLWLYYRLLGQVRGIPARMQFARCGANSDSMAKENGKETLAIWAGVVLGVAGQALAWRETGALKDLLGPGPETGVPALAVSSTVPAGESPVYREHGFEDFAFRVRLDTNEWQEVSIDRMKNRGILTFLVMVPAGSVTVPGGSDHCSLVAERTTGGGSDADRLADMLGRAEKESRMIVSRGSVDVSGKRVPCVVSRKAKPDKIDRFSAECRWSHSDVEFWLTMRSGSENPLDVPRFQHFLRGIELVTP